MKRVTRASMVAFGAGALAVLATGTAALADKPDPPPGWGIPPACPDVYYPVICSDGNIYSNACYALRAGQKNCVPIWDPINPLPL